MVPALCLPTARWTVRTAHGLSIGAVHNVDFAFKFELQICSNDLEIAVWNTSDQSFSEFKKTFRLWILESKIQALVSKVTFIKVTSERWLSKPSEKFHKSWNGLFWPKFEPKVLTETQQLLAEIFWSNT